MRKCCLLLLLPVIFGSRSPAAVFEDVFELGRPNIAFLATPQNQNSMQDYLSKRNRQLAETMMATAASHFHTYTAASERYQHFEESQNDRIRLENLKKIASVRTKRLDQIALPRQSKKAEFVPREVFKFTLSDAMGHRADPKGLDEKRQVANQRSKREETRTPKRVEPVPREILWFELKDAITQSPVVEEDKVHHRRRRSADPGNKEGREMVSFELQDAKTPDQDSNVYHKQLVEENPNLRMPFTTSDTFTRGSVFDEIVERPEPRKREGRKEKRDSPSEDADLSIEESRRVKVTRGGNKKKVANYDDLPLGVQKAIDIAIKENERMNGKTPEASQGAQKYYFGDKKPKTKKPFSSTTTTTKVSSTSTKDSKFTPSPQIPQVPQIETGFVPSKPVQTESGENLKPEKETTGSWWSATNLNRPKRLHQKTLYPPLVVSPQYVNTYKPTMESYKMKELSPGYEHSQDNSYEYDAPKEVLIQEKPKIQYVIKEVPVQQRVKESRTKITVRPTISISYDKEPSAPATSSEGGEQVDYTNPYGPVELRFEQPREQTKSFQNLKIVVPDSKEQTQNSYYESKEQPQTTYFEPKEQPQTTYYGSKEQTQPAYYDSKEQTQPSYYDSKEQTQPTYYENNHVEQSKPSESGQSYDNYEKTGSSIAALSALIGKRPTIQLKGLNELLHMPIPIGNQKPLQTMKTRVRPQESTAPIMFPMESSSPAPIPKKTTGYRSIKIENGPKIIYDGSGPGTLFHTVQMNPQLKVPMSKDYTPIKEVISDISDSDLVGPTIATPTHATYIISSTPMAPLAEVSSYETDANSHETANYQHLQEVHSTPETIVQPINVQYQTRGSTHHHQQLYAQHQHQQYEEQDGHDHEHHEHDSGDYDDSEGYAFGYRVRDFHTGNDFGHVQNRDNGVTRGEYHILLPDGRVQNVRYTADEQGFHADVSYESVHKSHESAGKK